MWSSSSLDWEVDILPITTELVRMSEWQTEAYVMTYLPTIPASAPLFIPLTPIHYFTTLCHCVGCSWLFQSLSDFPKFASTFLLLLFCPLFWIKMVLCFLLLHCSHFVEIVCFDFCLLLVMNHVSFLCIPQWVAQCMAHLKHWMVWKSCLCLWSSCLFILPHTQNPELVQTQNSELFSPLTHFRILLVRVPDSKLPLIKVKHFSQMINAYRYAGTHCKKRKDFYQLETMKTCLDQHELPLLTDNNEIIEEDRYITLFR